ncbi:barwin-like endoglucanase [Lentinus tigrinus ALCF2SS1-6]|uniref:Barwin-like endoglucanase n=1 Tax=Lentinus tigrinus ALCF2SS1-6 TaxID=1328759 RepID=A0A5C2SMU4_9APHY|nr:barwin-like endoglucanase [Lentinus tigrinus ALCF2SS1-6]
MRLPFVLLTYDGCPGTYYGTGLGSCGITNSDTDFIAAVSHELYDNYPGYDGLNPNNNPLCKRKIKATYQGKSVTVQAVDRCTGCAIWDLDFSPSAFQQLASLDVGRLSGVTWDWV